MKKLCGMRDSHEKGAGMRDQDPPRPPPFQTLMHLIEQDTTITHEVFFLCFYCTNRVHNVSTGVWYFYFLSVSTHKHEPIMERISNLNYDDDNL